MVMTATVRSKRTPSLAKTAAVIPPKVLATPDGYPLAHALKRGDYMPGGPPRTGHLAYDSGGWPGGWERHASCATRASVTFSSRSNVSVIAASQIRPSSIDALSSAGAE